MEHDHIPAFSSVKKAVNDQLKRQGKKPLTEAEETKLRNNLTTMEVKKGMHVAGRTYAKKGGQDRVDADARDLRQAATDDLSAHSSHVENKGGDAGDFNKSADAVHQRNQDIGLYNKEIPSSLWK